MLIRLTFYYFLMGIFLGLIFGLQIAIHNLDFALMSDIQIREILSKYSKIERYKITEIDDGKTNFKCTGDLNSSLDFQLNRAATKTI